MRDLIDKMADIIGNKSKLAKELKIDYTHLYRIQQGKARPSPELTQRMLTRFPELKTEIEQAWLSQIAKTGI